MDETTPASVRDGIVSMLKVILKRITRIGELRSRVSDYSSESTSSINVDTIPEPQEFPDPFIQQEVLDIVPQLDISNDIETANERIDAIQTQINEIRTAFSALTEVVFYMPVPTNENKVDRSEIDDLKQKTEVIEANLSENSVAVVTIEAKSDDMISRVSGIKKTISELISDQNDLSCRMNELQESIEKNTSEISDFTANSERVDFLYEHLDYLNETVSALRDDVGSGTATMNEEVQEEDLPEVEVMPPTACVKLNTVGNEPDHVKIVMELLQFLLELVGPNNLPSILDYYVEIGWISENARLELLAYASGMEDPYEEKINWKLSTEDHLKVLWFIEQLCGYKIDKNRLFRVDSEISKIRRGIDVLYEI
ncbi:MAG: FlaD/FlaE family flagellar protein [Euryarchaeota archaeon]|nr:FlaD/FlaE family flagellar protein [Euryarchaeota archaeon]